MDSIFTRTSGFLVSIVLCHKAFCLIKGLQCALTQNHYQQSSKHSKQEMYLHIME